MVEKNPSDRQAAMLMLDLSIVKRRDHWTIVTQNGSSEVVVPRFLIPSKYYSPQGWCLGCLGVYACFGEVPGSSFAGPRGQDGFVMF